MERYFHHLQLRKCDSTGQEFDLNQKLSCFPQKVNKNSVDLLAELVKTDSESSDIVTCILTFEGVLNFIKG